MVTFDSRTATAVLPSEQITASVFARSALDHNATLSLQMLDVNLAVIDTQSVGVTFNNGWNRFSLTRTVPAACVAVSFRVILGTANTAVFLAAPQVEPGPLATAWGTGGAAPVVAIDSFACSSPRFPLTSCELNLIEV